MLYELLKKNNREYEYLKLNANLKAVQSILTGITISFGAILISYSWNSVYYISSICLIISLAFLFVIKEPGAFETKKIGREMDTLWKIKNTILYPNIMFFLICIIGFSCFDGISGSYYNYNQIIFEKKNVSVPLIGFFFSITYLANSAAYFFAAHLAKKMPKKSILLRIMALQGLLFAVLAVTENKIAFTAISFICCMVPEVIYILADSIIQKYITSEYRATILSVVSMLRSLISAILYFVFGYIFNKTDIQGFMCFLAFITFGSLCCFKVLLTFGYEGP